MKLIYNLWYIANSYGSSDMNSAERSLSIPFRITFSIIGSTEVTVSLPSCAVPHRIWTGEVVSDYTRLGLGKRYRRSDGDSGTVFQSGLEIVLLRTACRSQHSQIWVSTPKPLTSVRECDECDCNVTVIPEKVNRKGLVNRSKYGRQVCEDGVLLLTITILDIINGSVFYLKQEVSQSGFCNHLQG